MFLESVLDAARAHADACYPRESCGVIVGAYAAERYMQLDNGAPHAEAFRIAPEIWLDMEREHGPIRALLHSHPWAGGRESAPDYPSSADMAGQTATAVPWGIIVATPGGCMPEIVWFGDQCPIAPIPGISGLGAGAPVESRYFRHGVTDCYSLIRDYYRLVYGISLREYPRDWEWWQDGRSSLYLDNYLQDGWRLITLDRAREGDMFFASVGSTSMRAGLPNHGGIYLGGRNHEILHHLAGRLPTDRSRIARREPGERWLKYMTHMLRHKERE